MKFEKNEFTKKYFGTYFALRVLQFGEFVPLDVACSMKLKQAMQTRAVSSIASEARSIIPEKQGYRGGRSARLDGP